MSVTIGDWYKITELSLDDDRLKARRASAARIGLALLGDRSGDIVACVNYALSLDSNIDSIEWLADAILEDQPSADRKTLQGSLDSRVCLLAALYEAVNAQVGGRELNARQVVASAISSALREPALQATAYVGQLLVALLGAADLALDAADSRRRERKDGAVARFEKSLASAGDASKLASSVQTVVKALNTEMLKDREELQALWWCFGGLSVSANKWFAELSRGEAAVRAGCELALIVSPPATRVLSSICTRQVQGDAAPFVQLLRDVSASGWSLLQPPSQLLGLVLAAPKVFPLTYIAQAVSNGDDVGTAAGNLQPWPATEPCQPAKVARQVFNEQALLRLLTP